MAAPPGERPAQTPAEGVREETMSDPGLRHQGVLDRLSALTVRVLGRHVRPDAPLLASGVSSLELVKLLDQVSAEWGVEIPVEVLFERGDIVGLANYLTS